MNQRTTSRMWALGPVRVWRSAWSVVRSFGRAKGFAVAAMLTVAIGVGVNSIVFSLFDRLLFRPLPYDEPERLVQIYSHEHLVSGHNVLPYAVALDLARQTDLFSGLGWTKGGHLEPMAPVAGENPLLWLTGMTTNSLDVLGIRPAIGAGFSSVHVSALDRPVLLTYDVWQRRYGGSDDVLTLEWVARDAEQREVLWRVVGVLPKGFLLPSSQLTTQFDGIYGIDPGLERQLSLRFVDEAPFARLAAGVSLTAAQAQVDTVVSTRFPRLSVPMPGAVGPERVSLVPLQSGLSSTVRSYVWLAALGAWAVLGATCLTLTILLLTWNQSRRQDAGVRLALGAAPRRLVMRALAESSFLCAVGTGIGWVAYAVGRAYFIQALPAGLQVYASETADLRVIVATCGLAVVSAIVAGTWPAIRASRTAPLEVMRPLQSGPNVGRLVGGPVLLTLQSALGVVLLVGATATVPSVTRALVAPPGFQPADLFRVSVPTANDDTTSDAREQVRRGREAVDVARALPGVLGASLARQNPLWPSAAERQVLQKLLTDPQRFRGRILPVDWDIFATLETRVLAGRPFSSSEIQEQALVAIVNEAGARLLSPSASIQAVPGQTVRTEDGPRVVVGVVEDFHIGMDTSATPALFLPLSAEEEYRRMRDSAYPWIEYQLLLRMAPGRVPDVTLLSDRLRERPWMLPRWVGARRESIATQFGIDVETPRLLALIFGTLGGISLLLVVIAVYGLASFEIRRRREEMTVRLALGATHQSLRRRLAVVTVRPIVVGVLVGLPISWIQTSLLARAVPALDQGDVRIYAAAAATMVAVALVAAWIPGRRSLTMRVTELLRLS